MEAGGSLVLNLRDAECWYGANSQGPVCDAECSPSEASFLTLCVLHAHGAPLPIPSRVAWAYGLD